MKTFKKVLKATVPMGSSGLMKALVLPIFFVGLLFLNSCANLIEATKKGDTARVNALLNKGANVNAKDENGWTGLMFASRDGHTNIVKALLEKGADVNARNRHGTTALIQAYEKGHTEIVKLLIDKGADVNAKDEKGVTALMWASDKGHADIVKVLLNKGADVNAKNEGSGATALMYTSANDYSEIVQALLNKGADVNIKAKNGGTALIAASSFGRTEIVKALIDKGADVNAKDEKRRTALMSASLNGHNKVVKILIDKGADVNGKDEKGNTALMLASKNGHTETIKVLRQGEERKKLIADLINAVKKGDTGRVKALLNKGADVNAKDEEGGTALMFASRDGRTDIVKMLLDKGAAIDVKVCEALWRDALGKNKLEAYKTYIVSCPDGAAIEEAKRSFEKMKYLNIVRNSFHYELEQFIKDYPNSAYLNDVRKRLHQFGKFKAMKDTFLSGSDLVGKYNWNKLSTAFVWSGGGSMKFTDEGNVLVGNWCLGNLQFEGGIMLRNDGLKLVKDTIMIYPLSKK